MCGRFFLTATPKVVQTYFNCGSEALYSPEPRYNIAPTQPIITIRQTPNMFWVEAIMMKWGLIPHWAKDPSMGQNMINARSETVAEKPSFRSAYKSRRCLIPVSGFYEWKTSGKHRQPHAFYRNDGDLFALAGIWEEWNGRGETIQSCAILTTESNELVSPIHHRMPAIIEKDAIDQWLDPSAKAEQLLQPREWPEFEVRPVSTYVNNANNQGPQCLASPEKEVFI